MKFDSNLAWKQASGAVSANRDVMLALAGAFFMLPSLVVALLIPQPQPVTGASQEAMMATLSEYYSTALPLMIPMAIVQMVGTLAMLTIFTDTSRPTVGQSIRIGLQSAFPYILSQLVFGIAMGVVGGVVLGLASVTGSPALGGFVTIALLVGMFYAFIKTSLVAPVIVVDGERNPIAALRRSWRLTGGNSFRIALFYLLIGLAFMLVVAIFTGLSGVLFALLAGAEGAKVGSAVVSSALWAVMTVFFVAVIAAVHRQLAGPAIGDSTTPFE